MGIKYKGEKGKISLKEEKEKQHSPVYLKFNFSYMNSICYELDETQSVCLVKTIFNLSNRPYLQIANERKATGFESIPLRSFDKKNMGAPTENDSSAKFESEDRKLSDKRDIFRIKDTQTGRMIGKIYRHVFYVFYLDFDGKAYNHGS